jgi:hypothetical protein
MFSTYVVVTLLAIAATTFSGVAALAHFKPRWGAPVLEDGVMGRTS